MKKISVLFAFLLVAAVTFVGCKKDEAEPDVPTITVALKSGYTSTAWKGDTVKYTVTMGSNEKLATLKIEPNFGNTGTNVVSETISGTSKTYDYEYVVPTAGVNDGDVVTITFTVTDDKDGKNTATQSITMDEPVTSTPLDAAISSSLTYKGSSQTDGLNENTTVGIKYSSNPTSTTAKVVSTSGNGLVLVTTVPTTKEGLQSLYDSGSTVTEITRTDGFSGDYYFAAKNGSVYYLVDVKTLTFSPGNNILTFTYQK